MAYAWIRLLSVKLSSTKFKKQMVFGENHLGGNPDLNIVVSGNKYMSALKDACTIKISNLTYAEVVQIINGEFYDVEITCGYKTTGGFTIFKGGVLYISNAIEDNKTNTIIILCGSNLVARFHQRRLNLSLNSGINVYSALKYVCRLSGIQEATISSQLKKVLLNEMTTCKGTAASIFDAFAQTNENLIINSDASLFGEFSIFDATRSNARVIRLEQSTIELSGGYPQLTTDGLRVTLLPTFGFMCGDVIKIDNSIIQIPVQSQSEIQKNYGYFIDEEGKYMIFEIAYNLCNRSAQFSMELTCKKRQFVSDYFG